MSNLPVVFFLCCIYVVLGSLKDDKFEWINFKSKHGKTYKNVQEEKLRFSIFQQKLHEIEVHNRQYLAGERTYKKAVNRFADLTKEETASILKQQIISRPNLESTSYYKKPVGVQLSESLDWREKGAVSDVKNQGSCGSCWAFSVTGTLESFNFLKTSQMVLFSEQQLVDCSTDNYGCMGGDEGPALAYVKEFGIQTENSYPYIADDGTCSYNESAVNLRIQDYVQITPYKEDDLLSAVSSLGPISVALDASDLFDYGEGVFTDNNCLTDATNHAVLAVGYGKDAVTGLDYWIVKNSWGPDWGEQGYFKIQRGSNECAIAKDCVYPVLN